MPRRHVVDDLEHEHRAQHRRPGRSVAWDRYFDQMERSGFPVWLSHGAVTEALWS
jgi:hypothetical protein